MFSNIHVSTEIFTIVEEFSMQDFFTAIVAYENR